MNVIKTKVLRTLNKPWFVCVRQKLFKSKSPLINYIYIQGGFNYFILYCVTYEISSHKSGSNWCIQHIHLCGVNRQIWVHRKSKSKRAWIINKTNYERLRKIQLRNERFLKTGLRTSLSSLHSYGQKFLNSLDRFASLFPGIEWRFFSSNNKSQRKIPTCENQNRSTHRPKKQTKKMKE